MIKRLILYTLGFTFLSLLIFLPGNFNDHSYSFRKNAFYDYFNPLNHILLSEYYQSVNNIPRVKDELRESLSLTKDQNQIIERFFNVWQEEQKTENIKKEVSFWEDYLLRKPNYRDGWIQLAILYYKTYQDSKALHALKTAMQIDPNYPRTKEIRLYFPQQ